MPQLSHDTASLGDDGFHEIHLSGKQLVFLFMAATVVTVVIFLCGVAVGRSVREQRGGETVDTSAAAAPASGVADAGPQAAEPPAPPAETPDELSYHKRLQGGGEPEQLKSQPAQSDTEVPARSATTPPTATTPPAPPQPAAADVQTSGRPGKWVVQVVAFQNRNTAIDLVKKLSARGYPAYLVPPESPSVPQIYRVRVGGYTDPREAEQVSSRIAREERFKPLVRPR